jgi:DNA-binding response OmpR family regulator
VATASGENTILVVEDQPGLGALAEEVLSSAGYSVLLATDGAEALRVAETFPGQIQLLLTDLTLPDSSGTALAARLTALRPELKVLFMSGHPSGVLTNNGTLDSKANFIEKPWTPRGLLEKIRAIAAVQPSALRILVVDDEGGVREWLTAILEESGHRVTTAKDGVEAKRIAARQPVDLLITDILMPNEEGLGIICALRKTQPRLKIIAMSGSNAEALVDSKFLGAHAALSKPFTAEMLLRCIRDLPAETNF